VDDATDEVVGMICVNVEDKTRTVLVVSEKGYGKRTAVDEYRVTNRGGKGVKTISVTEKTGKLVGILDVTEKEDLMITCVSGITIRTSIAQISEQGRATQGVKLIRLDDEDEIAAITNLDVVVEQVEVETDENIQSTDSNSTEQPTTETPDTPQEPEENNEN
jgi:DNA gyrase subunit A